MSTDSGADLRARMAALSPAKRELLTARLAEQGLLHHLDGGPERVEGEPDEVTVKQESLWRAHRDGDDGDFHHVGLVCAFPPERAPEDVARAVRRAIESYEALRGSYVAAGPDGARVRVHEADEVPVERVVAASPDPVHAFRAAGRLALRDGRSPFRLDRPPVRIRVLDARPAAVLLTVVAHDIACDRYGLRTVLLPALCGVPVAGRLRPREVAHWQRRSLVSGVVRQQVERTTARLMGSAPLGLPDSGDRTGARIPVRIDGATGRGLDRLARSTGSSLFAVLLAAWGSVVAECHNRAEILVGCCTSGRHRPELGGVLADLANTVVVRVQARPAARCAESIHRTRDELTAALGDGDAPFERVLAALTGDDAVLDQDIRVRLTLDEEDGTASLPGCLGVEDVDFGYAKTSLSLELGIRPDRGLAGAVAHRPADVSREAAAELTGMLHARLARLSRLTG
ncbi:condensation domain-containing protein [Embleya sp. NPDC005575]|uniref:condensation domain-containing protein n=1 Tax=Embleya sp. NPDC005575 TaxID=3156892 RepID=UPI0033B4597B